MKADRSRQRWFENYLILNFRLTYYARFKLKLSLKDVSSQGGEGLLSMWTSELFVTKTLDLLKIMVTARTRRGS